ncbi:MAG: hypothetical protein Q8P95_05500, partial [bacterium]|nr:hypothetical protein [bacterium]
LQTEIDSDAACFRKTYPIREKFPASIHIYDHSVILFTYTGNDPVGVHIESADITETLRQIFRLIEKDLR